MSTDVRSNWAAPTSPAGSTCVQGSSPRQRSGQDLDAEWSRLVSLTRRDLLAIRLRLEGADAPAASVVSGWRNRQDTDYLTVSESDSDPRRGRSFGRRVLDAGPMKIDGSSLAMVFRTARSGMDLALALDHLGVGVASDTVSSDEVEFTLEGPTIEKRAAYLLSPDEAQAEGELRSAPDFSDLAGEQEASLAEFWSHASVEIATDPGLQQAINWNLFQLHQASAQLFGKGIPAKGLTGPGV